MPLSVGDADSSPLDRFTAAVVYQGLIMRVGITGGNVYIDFFIAGVVELPAAFLILFTIERAGRRLPFATANIVAGVSCFITAFIPDSENSYSSSYHSLHTWNHMERVGVSGADCRVSTG